MPLLPAVWLCAFLVSLDFSAITIAMPTLTQDFGASTSAVSWASIAYMLAIVTLLPLSGFLIGRLGGGRALALGLLVFGAASVAAALSPTLAMLVAMRAVQGMGGAIMYVIAPILIRSALPEARQQRAFSVYTTAPFAGLCAGPLVGGQLTQIYGWQAVFWMNLPVTVLALALALRLVGRLPQPDAPAVLPRPLSIAGLSLAIGTLVLALNQGQEWGWTSAPVLGLLAASALAALLTRRGEAGTTAPLFDRVLLRTRSYLVATLALAVLSIGFGGFTFVLPFYFEWFRGIDTDLAGRILTIQPFSTIAVSVLFGMIVTAGGPRMRSFAGIGLFAAAFGIFMAADRMTGLAILIGGLVAFGMAIGLTTPTLIHASLRMVPPPLAPAAGSLQATLRVMPQLLGLVVFETIMSEVSPGFLTGAPQDGADGAALLPGFRAAFGAGLVVVLAAAWPVARLRAPDPSGRRPS